MDDKQHHFISDINLVCILLSQLGFRTKVIKRNQCCATLSSVSVVFRLDSGGGLERASTSERSHL